MKCNYDEHMKSLLDRFQWYCNDFEDSEDAIALKKQYLITAKQYVEQFLGYVLDTHEVTETHVFVNSRDIYLREFPIMECYSVRIHGQYVPAPLYSLRGDHVRLETSCCIHEGEEIEIQYVAGYRKIPDLIETTIFRLAALLKSEANGDIALTSKSYGTDGSRSFYNYQNWDKFMAPLYPFKTIKLT